MTDRHRRRFLHPRPACSLPAIALAWARSSRTPTLGQLQQRPEMLGRRLGGTAMQAMHGHPMAWPVWTSVCGRSSSGRKSGSRRGRRWPCRRCRPRCATRHGRPRPATRRVARMPASTGLRAWAKGLGDMRAGRTVWCARVGRHADASARRIAAWMTGVSWHLAGNLEWVPDCTQVRFDGAAAVGTGREKEKTLFSRLQVSCRTWRKR